MASGIISARIIDEIKNNPNILSYNVTGNGYFITIKHQSLPEKRIVCDKPMLIGECEGIETGFVIFIENNELTIECHGWGKESIPADYSDLKIEVREA